MSKPIGPSPAPRTHFEQVPVEIVKKIIDKDAPKPDKSGPPGSQRLADQEI